MDAKELLLLVATVLARQVNQTPVNDVAVMYAGLTEEGYVSVIIKKAGYAPQVFKVNPAAIQEVKL